jgi:4-amino-4-deoxy-L-arabinose transferase-like glycosyltransferase
MSSWLEKLAARPQRSIILLSLLLLLAGNWILPLTDRDEARFGEASREMIQRGDYVVPWFNGAWRFDKPVLIYWCQIASYRLLGDNDFAARLPSVLFTTATALLLVRWGRKISGDNKTGFLAGAMFATCLHVAIVVGRIATADMAMIFFSTFAAWSGWELTRPENPSRKKWWCFFYVALALGFLAKGPVAWLPLGGMILGRVLRKEHFRLPLNETLGGLCLAVALVALWGGPALAQTGGQFMFVGLGEHVIHRSFGTINDHGPKGTLQYLAAMPLYFATFLISFFPWTIRLPSEQEFFGFVDRVYFRRTGKMSDSKSSWKRMSDEHPHYRDQFQILKLIMLGLASFLFVPRNIRQWRQNSPKDNLGWYLLTTAAVVFVVFSLVKTKLPHYTMPAFPLIALWLARQIAGDTQTPGWFGKRLAIMVTLILVVTLGVFSFARGHLLTLNLWNATKPYVKPETKIGCFDYTEPSLVWRFRAGTTNYVTLGGMDKARDFLTNTPPLILVLPTAQLAQLPDTNGILLSVRGLDLVHFKNLDLTAIVRVQK